MLSRDGIVELATRSGGARALATVLIPLPENADPDASTLASACVVYARQGGFMVVVPLADELVEIFTGWGEEVGSEPAFYQGVAELETPRGRGLGKAEVVLIDVGWEFAHYFSPSSAFKGSGLSGAKAIQFEKDGVLARPSKASVTALAEAWIGSNMPEAAAQDYLTGEEVEEAELMDDGVQARGTSSRRGEAAEVSALQRRVRELEQALGQRDQQRPASAPGLGSAAVAATPKAPALFGTMGSPPQVSTTDWARLQRLAGPPPRAGAAEQRRSLVPPATQEADSLLTMMEKEAEAARDAYIRSMEDLPKLAEVVQINAAKELGLSSSRIDESLLRKYAERRMPLAESRLMTYLAFLMAEAWSVGHQSNNLELLGVVGKVMIFLEQASIDQGRLQLAWLMTGQQDPPFQILQSNKKRSGLTPFSRLAAPAWVAANLQYVKDLDVLESKMLTMGSGKPNKPQVEDVDKDGDNPRRQPKNPKRKGKKGDPGQEDSTSGA